jgi:hypothetical protein
LPTIYVDGQPFDISDSDQIGTGGEATVYKLGDQAVKIFRKPTDDLYVGNPAAQREVGQKLRIFHLKIRDFPAGLPAEVVRPQKAAYNSRLFTGRGVIGYVMDFVPDAVALEKLRHPKYRRERGIDGNQVIDLFRDIHRIVSGVHAAGAVIGDFSDTNVLVDKSNHAHFIDMDGLIFGKYYSPAYNPQFIDPLVYDHVTGKLIKRHDTNSDWYAYLVMLCQSLLCVRPFEGVHRPESGQPVRDFTKRIAQRLSILHPNVGISKGALSFELLSDELIEYMRDVFEKDVRGPFPLYLLDTIRWTTCAQCGILHARSQCPACGAPGLVRPRRIVRQSVRSQLVFATKGEILAVATQGGSLQYLYHEDGTYFREGRRAVMQGKVPPELNYQLQGGKTLIAAGNRVSILESDREPRVVTVDTAYGSPCFAANQHHRFWVRDKMLVRDGRLQATTLGEVYPRTRFWVGDMLGLGLARESLRTRTWCFVFDPRGSNIGPSVALKRIPGVIVDTSCVFDDGLAWLMVGVKVSHAARPSIVVSGQGIASVAGNMPTHVFCYVIDRSGRVVAEARTRVGDGRPLDGRIHGHLALDGSLYVATNLGIQRYAPVNGSIELVSQHPDVADHLREEKMLLASRSGVYAYSPRRIREVTFNRNATENQGDLA